MKLNISESNRIEFKEKLNNRFEREVVGFLNYHDGGVIYIGIIIASGAKKPYYKKIWDG